MNNSPLNTAFNDLLLRVSQESGLEGKRKIEKQLWEQYGATISTLVVDMSGFTQLTESYGVVHYLSMIRRMQLTTQPIIESYGGTIVKFEADNAFAHFNLPGSAIRAAIALNLALNAANLLTPNELDMHVSSGIDHGECLIPSPSDYYGGSVNRASKLGEYLGEPGQILVTQKAMSLVPDSLGIKTEALDMELGNKKAVVHSVIYQHNDASLASMT